MPVEFLGKEISVTLSEGEVRQPSAFKLGPKSYKVKEVIASWLDNAYGAVPARRRGWQDRPERQFYRVRTDEGDVFELYVDTPAGRKTRPQKARWYAHRRVTGAATAEGARQEQPPARKRPSPPPEPAPAEPVEPRAARAARPSTRSGRAKDASPGAGRARRPRGG